jgi:hypothetical protein
MAVNVRAFAGSLRQIAHDRAVLTRPRVEIGIFDLVPIPSHDAKPRRAVRILPRGTDGTGRAIAPASPTRRSKYAHALSKSGPGRNKLVSVASQRKED